MEFRSWVTNASGDSDDLFAGNACQAAAHALDIVVAAGSLEHSPLTEPGTAFSDVGGAGEMTRGRRWAAIRAGDERRFGVSTSRSRARHAQQPSGRAQLAGCCPASRPSTST